MLLQLHLEGGVNEKFVKVYAKQCIKNNEWYGGLAYSD